MLKKIIAFSLVAMSLVLTVPVLAEEVNVSGVVNTNTTTTGSIKFTSY
jgi:hypothetical protein